MTRLCNGTEHQPGGGALERKENLIEKKETSTSTGTGRLEVYRKKEEHI